MKKLAYLILLLLMNTALPAQDWADLDKYRAANEALTPPAEGDARVVFMGNSITESWAADTAGILHNNKNYVGRGISGQTTPQMLIRFRPDVLALQPEVVVILAGINDIAHNTGPMSIEETAGNIYSMAELAEANGIEVVLCSVLPAYDFPWRPGMEPAQKVVALNRLLKDYADRHGHVYVDFFTPMADGRPGLPARFAYDEVHPTALGYRTMEPLVERGIRAALAKR